MSSWAWLVAMVVVATDLQARVSGFNLNVNLSRILRGNNDSYYGYSVALWHDQVKEKSLVVGAPRGRSSKAGNYSLPLGDIYVCKTFSDTCDPLPSLPSLSYTDRSQEAVWWGATMQNQGIGFGETLYTTGAAQSKLLACAPRYPRKVVSHDYISLHGRGACYVLSTKAGEVIKVLPYPGDNFQVGQKTYKNTNALTAFALAGSSGVLSQDQHYVYLGGPYAFFGQGILVSMLSSGTKWMETNKATYGAEELDFSMEGWALAVGKFDGAREALATSLPGADHSRGAINFVNARLKPEPGSSVYGQEMGAQFGYCLAAGDVDGDGVDDLIVGAPLAQGRGSQTPDAGKVYIYYGPLVKVT
nr:integrin alpha-5-like [Procambarus clarkii]